MFIWYLAILIIGVGFMPLTACLCRDFRDGGWMVSKTIGLLLSVWVFFVLNVLHVISFVMRNCRMVVGVLILLNLALYIGLDMKKYFQKLNFRQILLEEVIFAVLLAVWIRIISFKPEAYGTEKFMDYAFMTAMTRALYMPFEDMWFAGEAINYYYGGQFVAAWLTKLTGISVGVGYNAMRATVAAFSFTLPFGLVLQMMADRLPDRRLLHYLSAGLSGLAVAFCGNMHYVVYGIIQPLFGLSDGKYWFPDATRYIGYNPDLPDKTIHEFPAYSTILGDLHAHYVNIIFVVTVTTVAYAYGRRRLGLAENENMLPASRHPGRGLDKITKRLPGWLCEGLGQPEIWLIGIFTGLFKWTNYWDFPIYVVVCGALVLFANLRAADYNMKKFLPPMLVETALVFLTGYIACLPFTATFEMISSEIGPTHSHTQFHQLLILWGLPFFVTILFAAMLFRERRAELKLALGASLRTPPSVPRKILDLVVGDDDDGEAPEDGRPAAAQDLEGQTQEAPASGRFSKRILELVTGEDSLDEEAWEEAGGGESFQAAAHVVDADPEAGEAAGAAAAVDADPEAGEAAGAAAAVDVDPQAGEADQVSRSPRFAPCYPDMAALLLAICAVGLVLLPEIIYVKDIYQGDYYRANTMFKLSYQAFILFGIVMGYVLIRALALGRRLVYGFATVGLICLLLTAGYSIRACRDWFGNVFDSSAIVSQDASVFVAESFQEDFEAIDYLNRNVNGAAVVLEAPGDSYSGYERVSVATGLATPLGWYVHEWLWRSGTELLNVRAADIETIYTGTDEAQVRSLVEKYGIDYIYIGVLERQKYPAINDALLQSLGEVAFSDGMQTYIIKVAKAG